MDKIMSPIFLAVGLLAVVAFLQLALYLSLRMEVQNLRKSLDGKLQARRDTKDSLRSEMMKISEELVGLTAAAQPAPIGHSMNLSRRNQVLRMHLRGDAPSRIADALKISKTEVELLLKVHKTVLPPVSWGEPPARTSGEGDAPSKASGSVPRDVAAATA
jgi:hypothetical protein